MRGLIIGAGIPDPKHLALIHSWGRIKHIFVMSKVTPAPKKRKFNIHKTMRALHRDVGFLLIGMAIIYSLSGITMIYRDKGVFDVTNEYAEVLDPALKLQQVGQEIEKKNLKEVSADGAMLHFKQGTKTTGKYNSQTGETQWTAKEPPFVIKQFQKLHKAGSKDAQHWFSVIFGVLFLFLGISSFWMFKPGTRLFNRGVVLAILGIIGAIALLYSQTL